MSTTVGGIRIEDMPDIGAITDDSSVVGEHAGSGRFSAPALRAYTMIQTGIVNVRDYGARGDGVTNDSPAFNAAVADAVAKGYAVYVPPHTAGGYVLATTVLVDVDNFTIFGLGTAATMLLNGTTNAPALQIGAGTTTRYNIRVAGLYFGQKSGVAAVSGNCGLSVQKVGNSRFENLSLTGALRDGIVMSTVSMYVMEAIQGISTLSPAGTGLSLDGCLDLYMTNCLFSQWTTGVQLRNTQGGYFANVSCYANTGSAWMLVTGGSGNVNNFFTNCIGDTSGADNWWIAHCQQTMFVNCWGSTQISTTANAAAAGFTFTSSTCNNVVLTNCVALANNASGIHLATASGSPANISLVNCELGSSGFGGTVLGNGKGSGGGYGLTIDGGVSGVKVVGGIAVGNVTGAVQNNGTFVQIESLIGFTTRARGQANLPGAATSVTVNHGLGATPSPQDIMICPTSALGSAKTLWVDTVTATSFTVHADVAPTSVSPYFNWWSQVMTG